MIKTNLQKLSSTKDYETKKILKKSISASRALPKDRYIQKEVS